MSPKEYPPKSDPRREDRENAANGKKSPNESSNPSEGSIEPISTGQVAAALNRATNRQETREKKALDKESQVKDFARRFLRKELMSSPADKAFLQQNFRLIEEEAHNQAIALEKRKIKEAADAAEKVRIEGLVKDRVRTVESNKRNLNDLSEEELRKSLQLAKLDSEGEKEQLINRLVAKGITRIEPEPIEDWNAHIEDLSKDFKDNVGDAGPGIQERMADALDPQVRSIKKKLEQAFLNEREFKNKYSEHATAPDRKYIPLDYEKVEESQYEDIQDRERSAYKLPGGRRRIGFLGEGINKNTAVRVGMRPSGPYAQYETEKNPEKTQTIKLVDEKTPTEAEMKSIYEKRLANEPLSPYQTYQMTFDPLAAARAEKRLGIKKEDEKLAENAEEYNAFDIAKAMLKARQERVEKESKEWSLNAKIPGYSKMSKEDKLKALEQEKEKAIKQMGFDLLHVRDLTPKQEALWNSSKEIQDRVKLMLDTGQADDKFMAERNPFVKLANSKIEEARVAREPDLISYEKLREDLKKNIPDFEKMDRETQEYLLAEAHKQEKKEIGEKNIKGFKTMDDKKKAEALKEYRYKELKKDQFKQDDLLGVEGYKNAKRREKESLEAMGIRRSKSIPEISPAEEAQLLVKKQRVEDSFKKMNLNKEKIVAAIPNFFLLDEDKQFYVLEKMRQKVNEDAGFDAEKVVAKDIAESGWGGRIWKSITKKPRLERARLDLIKKEKNRELGNYTEDMKALANYMEKSKLPLSYDENGKLHIAFENENSGDSTPAFIREFNDAATRLSEIPYEWTLKSATKGERMIYEKALYTYESRKRILYENKMGMYKLEKGAPDLTPEEREQKEDEALLWISQLDAKVKTNQFLTSRPELTGFDDEGLAKKTWLGIKTTPEMEWAAGATGGLLARWATRKSIGAVAGIGGAIVLAGIAGWKRKEKEFQALEKKKRHGEKVNNKSIKDFLDLKKSNEKIEYLITRIERAETAEKRDEMREILIKRMNNLHLAIEEGRIDPGSKREQTVNRLNMLTVMDRADEIISMTEPSGQEFIAKLEEKLERFYENRIISDGAADLSRRNEKIWSAVKGMATVGVAATAGYMVKDVWDNLGSRQTYLERVEEIIFEGGDGKWDDVSPEIIQGVPASPNGIPMENAVDTGGAEQDDFSGSKNNVLNEVPKPPVNPLDQVPTPPVAEVVTEDEFSGADAGGEEVADATKDKQWTGSYRPGYKYEAPDVWRGDLVLLEQFKENFEITRDASGNIVDIEAKPQSLSKIKSVIEFRRNPDEFLIGDLSRTDLPSNFQTESWATQALVKAGPDAEKFLANQELLAEIQKVDPKSLDIPIIKKEMMELGGKIRDDIAEFAKANSGKNITGNLFAPFEDWAAKERMMSGFENLTASVEDVGEVEAPEVTVPADQIMPETPAEEVAAPEEQTSPSVESTSIEAESAPEIEEFKAKGYNLVSTENSETIEVDNEYMKGEVVLKDVDGKITEVVNVTDHRVDSNKYFENGWDNGLSAEDARADQFYLQDYINHKALLDAGLEHGIFDKEDEYYKVLERRMAYSYDKINELLSSEHQLSPEEVKNLSESTGIPIEDSSVETETPASASEETRLETSDLEGGGTVNAEISPSVEKYTYNSDQLEGDFKITLDEKTGKTRLVEDWSKFKPHTDFNGNPFKFLLVDPKDMAKYFADNPQRGERIFEGLIKDYLRDQTLLGRGGVESGSIAAKYFTEDIEQIKKIVLEKTGKTLESILRPTK